MLIFDSSTLILLARIGLLEAFSSRVQRRVIIPEAVKKESCTPGKEETPFIEELLERGVITSEPIANNAEVQKLMTDFSIDRGEAETIVFAHLNNGAIVATDDRNAIRACRMLNIGYITAISIVITLFEQQILSRDDALSKLEGLRKIGRYSSSIMEDVTRRITGVH